MAYIVEQVRKDDPDRYLVCLFEKAAQQNALFSLYAFNQELAKTRENISDPMLGEIRLLWWKEALDGIVAGTPREHPVIDALGLHLDVSAHIEALTQLIDARRLDIYSEGAKDFDSLIAYVQGTGGRLNRLALTLAAPEAGSAALSAAEDIGNAWAMTGLLRAAAFQMQHGNSLLPVPEIPSDVTSWSAEAAEAMTPLFEQMTKFTRSSLHRAQKTMPSFKGKGCSAFLLAHSTTRYLDAIEMVGAYEYSRRPLEPLGAGFMFRLFWKSISGKL